LIEEFGGLHGLRDEGALESALTAAENLEYYKNADLLRVLLPMPTTLAKPMLLSTVTSV